ncbi:MAG TPA: copper chaperone PCu(A)C [Croceibacterium sp.]|nr:copper chaperone PCu(A)C [Croceibacterium sp.]
MKRLACTILLPLSLNACSQPGPPEVEQVWTRDTIGGSANAAVFMTITSPAADRLVAASTPVARKTDLMTMAGGSTAMEMTYVEAIDLPAGQPVSLNPAGLHVWLAGLNRPLRAGETFPLVLEFEHAGERRVTVSVIAPAAVPPGTR